MSARRSRAALPDAPEPIIAEPPEAKATQPNDEGATRAEYMQIDQVASRTGLTKRALRYYEEIGLLDPPTRTEGNYRLYSERDIARVESIKRWREFLGFSLAEIRKLVGMEEERQQARDDYRRASDARDRLAVLDHSDDLARNTLKVVAEKIAGLEAIRAELRERLERHERLRTELRAEMESQ
ncbi:MAG TPA: MerR family transcriptional regulator [Ktedonobacterales bacterium]|nr:MerR family transcriptional regulator [Ktedonobacterales bacterium]